MTAEMAAKAKISSGYRWRLGIIGLVGLGFGFYCLYDGFIKYPELQRMELGYQDVLRDHPDDWQDYWPREAAKNGWPDDVPGKPRSNMSIYTQYIMAAIVFPFGILFGQGFVRSGGRWVASDDTGLSANGDKRIVWADIRSVDTSRWKTKGIAVVHYENSGTDQHITLDDWKFERNATNEIFSDLKAHTTGLIEDEVKPDEDVQEQRPTSE